MPIAVPHVIVEVRRILQDNSPGPRNSDGDIRGAMRMALATMRSLRPDIFVYSSTTALPDVNAAELELEEQFTSPLVYLTTANMMLQNDEFQQDGTAHNLIAIGSAQLTGGMPR